MFYVTNKIKNITEDSIKFSHFKITMSLLNLMHTTSSLLDQYSGIKYHLGDFLVPFLEVLYILKNTIYFLGTLLFLPLSLIGGFEACKNIMLSATLTLCTMLMNVATITLSVILLVTRNLISLMQGYSAYTKEDIAEPINRNDEARFSLLESGVGFLWNSERSEESNYCTSDDECGSWNVYVKLIQPGV